MHTTQYVIYVCILAMVILFFYDVARSFIHASLQLFFKSPSIIYPNPPAIFFKKSPGVIEIQVGVGICFLLHTYLQFVTIGMYLYFYCNNYCKKSFIFMYFDKIFPSARKYTYYPLKVQFTTSTHALILVSWQEFQFPRCLSSYSILSHL